jgi:hypothetical protein
MDVIDVTYVFPAGLSLSRTAGTPGVRHVIDGETLTRHRIWRYDSG